MWFLCLRHGRANNGFTSRVHEKVSSSIRLCMEESFFWEALNGKILEKKLFSIHSSFNLPTQVLTHCLIYHQLQQCFTHSECRPIQDFNSKAHSPDESNHKMYKIHFNWLHSWARRPKQSDEVILSLTSASAPRMFSEWWIPFNLSGGIIASFKLECERQRCLGAYGARASKGNFKFIRDSLNGF